MSDMLPPVIGYTGFTHGLNRGFKDHAARPDAELPQGIPGKPFLELGVPNDVRVDVQKQVV